jgi:hypothetical protein
VTASRAGAALLVAVALLVVAGCGGGGTLGPKSLAKRAEAVQSLAAEGALLAEDSSHGRSTRIFREQHSSELEKAASSVVATLKKGKAEPSLEPKLHRLAAIAARVRAGLGQLGGASTREQREIAKRLDAAARESEKLGEDLG